MKYDIKYKHMIDGIKDTDSLEWKPFVFNSIVESANYFCIELSDDDFIRFYKLELKNKDINFIMNLMATYDKKLIDALVTYITF